MTPRAARAFQISVLDERIEELNRLHQRLESYLRRDLTSLPKALAEMRQALRGEERELLEQMYSDEHYLLEKVFPRNLRYSSIVSAYTLLETGLNGISHGERRRSRHRLGLKDLDGRGIERAKSYLEKVCRVSFPSKTAEWTRMKVLAKVRNVIAHADGDVTRANHGKRIVAMVRATEGLILHRSRYVEVEPEFISETLRLMKRFFLALHNGFPEGSGRPNKAPEPIAADAARHYGPLVGGGGSTLNR